MAPTNGKIRQQLLQAIMAHLCALELLHCLNPHECGEAARNG